MNDAPSGQETTNCVGMKAADFDDLLHRATSAEARIAAALTGIRRNCGSVACIHCAPIVRLLTEVETND